MSCSLCRAPALCLSSVSDPSAVCPRPRRSLCWGPVLSTSGAGALCWDPALSLSGPRALCVRARRSLCRALCPGGTLPPLSVSGPSVSVSVSGPTLSLLGPGALCVRALSVSGSASRPSTPARRLSRPACARVPSSDPHVTRVVRGAHPRSACHFSDPRATHPVLHTPYKWHGRPARHDPRAAHPVPPSSDLRATDPSSPRFPGPKHYCLGVLVAGFSSLCVTARRSSAVSMSGARRSVSGHGALCVGARSFVSGPGAFCQGPALYGALYVGAQRSLSESASGPGALCVALRVGARRSPQRSLPGRFLFRSSALFSAVGVGAGSSPAISLCRVPALSVRVYVGTRRPLPTLFVSGLGALYVRARRSVCRGQGPNGALCVGARRCLSQGPALCVGRQRFVSGPGTFCRGPALLASGRSVPALFVRARRSLCRGAAVCVSRPNDLCVGARRFLCRASLCVGVRRGDRPALFVSGPPLRGPSSEAGSGPSSNPRPARPPARIRVPPIRHCGTQLRSPPAPIRVPLRPCGPQLESACHPSSPARSLFPGENPRPYCLGENFEKETLDRCMLMSCSSACPSYYSPVLFGFS